jgi:hypothetical protein
MYVVRDVFRCKPGKTRELAERFKRTFPSVEQHDAFSNCRVLVDVVADYWTVVLECDFEHFDDFERHMQNFSARPEVREALHGYMDLVIEGHREIYRVL